MLVTCVTRRPDKMRHSWIALLDANPGKRMGIGRRLRSSGRHVRVAPRRPLWSAGLRLPVSKALVLVVVEREAVRDCDCSQVLS